MIETITAESFTHAADVLADATAKHRPVRITGGATKLGWGNSVEPDALRLSTAGLAKTLAIRPADRIATFEAGVPLHRAQAELAEQGLTIAIDPLTSVVGRAATIGGVFATGDSGPRAHSGGRPAAIVLDLALALATGTVVHTGSAVLRSADTGLTRLLVGSFGALGAILAVTVRVEPLTDRTTTVTAVSDSPELLARAGGAINRRAFTVQCLDYAWRDGRGGVLVRLTGDDSRLEAEAITDGLTGLGLSDLNISDQDELLWHRQRQAQRSAQRALVRVDAPLADLPAILHLADRCDALSAGRLTLGTSYLTMNVNRVAEFRAGLPESAYAVALDVPQGAAGAVPAWPPLLDPQLALIRRLKSQLDPAGICNPGILCGGI